MKEVGRILFPCLFFFTLNAYSQISVEVGFGVGLWHESHIVNADSKQSPLQVYAELGSERSLFSMTFFYDFKSSYTFENYQLNPDFYGVSINHQLFGWESNPIKFRLLASAGVIYEIHHFIDNGNINVPGYEFHEEYQEGFGYAVGVIPKLYFKNLVLSTQFQWLRSNQKFIAGQFDSQTFQTGSNRLVISLAYQFIFNENQTSTCPTYF